MVKLPRLQVKKRIILLFVIIFIITFLLFLRLVWIQVINSDQYQRKAMEQRLHQIKVEPKRGVIYDRKGRELAISASSETVVAIPLEIKDPDSTARQLSRVLKMDYQTVLERLTRKARAVYVKRKLDANTAAEVRQLELDGIIFAEESKRFYPKENLASHLLGFAGIDSQGLDGMELSYDKYLKGVAGKIEAERDATGRSIPEGIQEFIAPQDGYNIYLTIDEVIQYIAERELDQALKEFDVSGGTIIVMDPNDGGLLAMANRPDYNPNHFADYPQKYWRNRAISDSFEPGSTFKIITTAAALEEGVVNENDLFVDAGHITVSGEKIKCWKAGGHGRQTFAEVVMNSCNPGFVQVGMRLGKEAFYNYITAFGFGDETRIKLPGEANGLLTDYDDIGPVELATITFGHGITVTPIQLIAAVSAVANDGMLLKPRLVKEIRTPEGELVEEFTAIPVRQVLSQKTAERTLQLLEKGVAEGTGRNAGIDGYRIGGKTGTAKHYGAQIYDSSFIGILPIDDPTLVILVVLYDVTGFPYYGSQTAAPVFRNVALDVLRYLDIPPRLTEEEKKQSFSMVILPDLRGVEVLEGEKELRKSGLDVRIIGSGSKIINQVPLPGIKVYNDTTVLLFTEEPDRLNRNYYVAVPDLTGLAVEEAAHLLAELGLLLDYQGQGKIIKQEIKAGSRIPGGSKVTVTLEGNG